MHRMIMRRIKRAHQPFYNIIVTPGPQKYVPPQASTTTENTTEHEQQRRKSYRPSKQLEILGQWDPIARETPQSYRHVDQQAQSSSSSPSSSSSSSPTISTASLLDPPLPLLARLERRLEWNIERVQYWLEQGAQPSPLVQKFLVMDGLWPLPDQSRLQSQSLKSESP